MNAIKLPLKQGTFLDWEAYDSNDEICFIAFDGAESSPEKTAAIVAIVNQRYALLEALEKAKQFIENGIELGYIRMPDSDTPDSAHQTLPIINAAIAAAKGEV